MSGRSLLRIGDLNRADILAILDGAQALSDGEAGPSLRGRILGLFFTQASTRTRFGFQSATARLQGTAITLDETKHEAGMSAAESFEDTIRVVSAYCDGLVVRHAEESAPERACAVSSVPVINAGNGSDEHPTQALIDLFSIRKWHGRLDRLRTGIVGDLTNSRAAHSLVRSLAQFDPAEIRVISPKVAPMPHAYLDPALGSRTNILNELAMHELDVLYMAGLPAQVGEQRLKESERARYRLTGERAASLPSGACILCPLPRIDEIETAVDQDPRAVYFVQSAAAQFIRMSVLSRTMACGAVAR